MNKQEAIQQLKAMTPILMRSGECTLEMAKAQEMAISAIEQQLNGGWIPVSERLPEENGHYLVTYHEWGKGEYLPEFDFTCVKILRFYHGEFKMPVCCNDKIEQDIGREVLAWRELPEIWKEDNDAEGNKFKTEVNEQDRWN